MRLTPRKDFDKVSSARSVTPSVKDMKPFSSSLSKINYAARPWKVELFISVTDHTRKYETWLKMLHSYSASSVAYFARASVESMTLVACPIKLLQL